MNLGRADPGFSTRDEVFGPFELCGRIVYPELRLSEQKTGGDDAGQEGEDYRRVRTRWGAHLGGVKERERNLGRGGGYKYQMPVVADIGTGGDQDENHDERNVSCFWSWRRSDGLIERTCGKPSHHIISRSKFVGMAPVPRDAGSFFLLGCATLTTSVVVGQSVQTIVDPACCTAASGSKRAVSYCSLYVLAFSYHPQNSFGPDASYITGLSTTWLHLLPPLSPTMNLLRGFVGTLTAFCVLGVVSAQGSACCGPHLQETFRVGKLPNVTWAIGRQYAGNLPIQRGTNLSLFFWGVESERGSLTAPAGKNDAPWNIWLNGYIAYLYSYYLIPPRLTCFSSAVVPDHRVCWVFCTRCAQPGPPHI